MNTVNNMARERAIAAMAGVNVEPTSLVGYTSRNLLLIIGNGQKVIDAVSRLPPEISAHVLVTEHDDREWVNALPETTTIAYAKLNQLEGHLGDFHAWIDHEGQQVNLAQVYYPKSTGFDLVLDLDLTPHISHALPPYGYFAPTDEVALDDALQQIPDMVGEFDKPRFFEYDASICAHGNSGLNACHRCLDACPAGAITSLKEKIEVDPWLCQGGGVCATVCPSGAIRYVYPRLEDNLEKIRRLLKVYRENNGEHASLLLHDNDTDIEHDTLPGHVIPFAVEEIGSAGMDTWLNALAYGADQVCLLLRNETPAQVRQALDTQIQYAHALLKGMGYDTGILQQLNDAGELAAVPLTARQGTPATMMAMAAKRDAIRLAMEHLYKQQRDIAEIIDLPAGAPFGQVSVNGEKCTLCLSCVSVCPAKALSDGTDEPKLMFTEANCVQCGLCSQACPEWAITLSPRYHHAYQQNRRQRVLHEEVPFCCTSCGKPFATQSVINRITEKLKSHAMFQSEAQLKRLQMCDDCRVKDMFREEMEAGV